MQRVVPIIIALVFMAVTAALAAEEGGKKASPPWKFEGELRLREDIWDWFDVRGREADSTYAFLGARLRLRALYRQKSVSGLAEVQGVGLFGLPQRSVLTTPSATLGQGANYYQFANSSSLVSFGVRRVQLDFTLSKTSTLRLGRFDFSDGADSRAGDATLDAIKSRRIAQRLIGSVNFSQYGRCYDGIGLNVDMPQYNVSLMASHPTQGVYNPDFSSAMPDVSVGYLSVTAKGSAKKPFEARLFGIQYADNRNVTLVDNRTPRGNVRAQGGISVTTFGANVVGRAGNFDYLGWYAVQSGKWGGNTQSSWAAYLEGGYQLVGAPWAPWLRVGWQAFSGDPDPGDAAHNTFFPVLMTNRFHTQFPFYTFMNVEDRSVALWLKPGKRLTASIDYHDLQLCEPRDNWYAGSGAFSSSSSFGYTGTASAGGKGLAKLLNIGVTYKVSPGADLSLYMGTAAGGEVVGATYNGGQSSTFSFLEYTQRF